MPAIILFIGIALFAAPEEVRAVQCCIEETARERASISTSVSEYTFADCRLKENTQCKTQVKRLDCFETTNARSCTLKREREINCLEHIRCRDKVIETITKCPELKPDQCEDENNRSTCFLVKGQCYALNDRQVCEKIDDPTLCREATACDWVEGGFRGDRCASALEKNVSDQYDGTETGGFLTSCAVKGTCRDVDDVLQIALNAASSLFSLLGVIGFVMFIYGGMKMILSFGNPEKFKSGRMALMAAIVGIVIAFSAYLLVNFLLDSLGVDGAFRAIN